jgi:hypothetical protein
VRTRDSEDVSDEKRRGVLEWVFFHDLLDTGIAVRSLPEIVPELSGRSRNEMKHTAQCG